MDYKKILKNIEIQEKDYLDKQAQLNEVFYKKLKKYEKNNSAYPSSQYEEKNMICWSEQGWSFFPIGLKNEESINSMMKQNQYNPATEWLLLQLCNYNMIFKEISSVNYNTHIYKAIQYFKNKDYLTCSMLLFAGIEGIIIDISRENVHVGRRAIDDFYKKIKIFDSKYEEDFLYLSPVVIKTTYICYRKLYDGNNFKKEPDIVNRNYIMHGVSKRDVCKTDCLKLFLLYYNVTMIKAAVELVDIAISEQK